MSERDWAESDYSRIYHSVIDDPKFADVYPNDAAWAAYTRLLMVADMAYPTRPPVPASVKRAALATLTQAGIVVVSGGHYTIPALSKERAARYGGKGGRPKYPSDKTPPPEPTRSDTGDSSESVRSSVVESSEATRAGASRPPPLTPSLSSEGGAGGNDERDSLDAYYELTLYRPWGAWSGDKIHGAIADYGDATVEAAMRAEHDVNPDRATLLDRMLARLAKEAERAKREKPPKPRLVKVRDEAAYQQARRDVMGAG